MSPRRTVPVLLSATLLAACTASGPADDGSGSGSTTTTTTATTAEPVTVSCPGTLDPAPPSTAEQPEGRELSAFEPVMAAGTSGVLDLGALLPVTGELAHLAAAQRAGIELAVADLNAAGGVLGSPITLSEADSGGPGDDLARPAARRLLDAGVDAVIGTASEGTTLAVIDDVTGAGVVLFSPHNNAPAFTDYQDAGRYFRTSPSDTLQGRALAELVAADGAGHVTVLARSDGYGLPIRSSFEAAASTLGLEVAVSTYGPADFDAARLVERSISSTTDAVVVIGLLESATIIDALDATDRGPQQLPTYGVGGNLGDRLADVLDEPGVLACMRGVVPAAPTPATFLGRLQEQDPALVDAAHAVEAYDAVVITALAAELAGTDGGDEVASAIPRVTRGGTPCGQPSACLELLADPAFRGDPDVVYDGVGGRYGLSAAGDPTAATFRVVQFDADGHLQVVGERTTHSA